jgi:hypothetical protein
MTRTDGQRPKMGVSHWLKLCYWKSLYQYDQLSTCKVLMKARTLTIMFTTIETLQFILS